MRLDIQLDGFNDLDKLAVIIKYLRENHATTKFVVHSHNHVLEEY